LVTLGESVPEELPQTFALGKRGNPYKDERLYDFRNYPEDLYAKPGAMLANRAALAKWGAWANAFGAQNYDRPLFIACSADLAESTNIAGFAKAYGDFPGYGWYERKTNPGGVLLPQEITEFANAGIMAGLATVNLGDHPEDEFDGFWGACSTYGSFSYLKYGAFRLLSQLAQDCDWKVGKVLWVAGHSGPETADDSRTHFGIFEPGVTQLFPEGAVINLHPWEYNEVPVLLGTAFGLDVPIVALHLTRPPVEIPDREALGIPSHLAAARGAYVLRDYQPGLPRGGTVFIRGTMPTRNLVNLLPSLAAKGINVKIVAAVSPQLFARQPSSYQHSVASPADRLNAMVITNGAFKLMREWADGPLVREYSLSSDWDDRWRTGGSVDEVIEEAHLDEAHILAALERFAAERDDRRRRLRELLDDGG
jgi:transketolase